MNSFRILVVLYALIVGSLVLAQDDYNNRSRTDKGVRRSTKPPVRRINSAGPRGINRDYHQKQKQKQKQYQHQHVESVAEPQGDPAVSDVPASR